MSKLPSINEVVARVLSTAGEAQTEKIANDAPPPKEYSSDVADSIKKLAEHLRGSPSLTYEDVFSVGNKLLRIP